MSTTKPDTDTGWAKGWPENGNYWRRSDPSDAPQLVRIQGAAYRLLEKGTYGLRGEHINSGMAAQIRDPESYEYLGPISPDDFEQLLRLREKATALLEHIFSQSASHEDVVSAATALREALGHTGEQS